MKFSIGVVDAPLSVRFEERELPVLRDGESLIKVQASALCGSDVHIYRGKHPSVRLPATIGHEFSGTVEQIQGPNNGFRVGQRVVLEPIIACGECDPCRQGQYGYCEHVSFSYREGDGSMAAYVKCNTRYLHALPDSLSFEAGALVEPLAVAVHAVKRAGVKLGDRVVVLGAGAIGILITAVCRACGAATVLVSDLSDKRLELATAFGATHTVNARQRDTLDAAAELFPSGADLSFECAGAAVTFGQAMKVLKRDGTMLQVGIFEDYVFPVDVSRFVTHEIRIIGAQGYIWDFPDALHLAQQLPMEKLITHTYPLAELKTALDTASNPQADAVKVLLKP